MRTNLLKNSVYSLNIPDDEPLKEEELYIMNKDSIPSNPKELSPMEITEMDEFLTNEEKYFEWLIASEEGE